MIGKYTYIYTFQLLPRPDLNQEIKALTDIATTTEPSSLPRNDDDPVEGELTTRLFRLHVDPHQNRFFGKSRYRTLGCYFKLQYSKISPVDISWSKQL